MTSAPAPSTSIEAAGQSHVGCVRGENQDALVLQDWIGQAPQLVSPWHGRLDSRQVCFFGVVDGMGGHAGGAAAAMLAAGGLREVSQAGPEGRAGALERLSDRVNAAGRAWNTPQMGATVAVLMVEPSGVRVFNLGDCRVVRLVDGYLGELTVEDRTQSAHGPLVTQSLGGPPCAFDPHELALPHPPGRTRYLLCSDGLVLDDATIGVLLSSGTPMEAASALVQRTIQVGAPDNVSVIVVDVDRGEYL